MKRSISFRCIGCGASVSREAPVDASGRVKIVPPPRWPARIDRGEQDPVSGIVFAVTAFACSARCAQLGDESAAMKAVYERLKRIAHEVPA